MYLTQTFLSKLFVIVSMGTEAQVIVSVEVKADKQRLDVSGGYRPCTVLKSAHLTEILASASNSASKSFRTASSSVESLLRRFDCSSEADGICSATSFCWNTQQ